MLARSLSGNSGPVSPWEIFAKLPDSLAPELLQLLTPEFRNVLGGKAQVSEKNREIYCLGGVETGCEAVASGAGE